MQRSRLIQRRRPTSPRKAEANRLNSRRSTGPKTSEGKLVIAANALKHGMESTALVLPSEDADEWNRHVAACVEDLAPPGTGYTQRLLAEEYAGLVWRLRRVRRYELAAIEMIDPVATADAMSGESSFTYVSAEQVERLAVVPTNDRMKKVMRYEAHLSRLIARTLSQLEASRDGRRLDLLTAFRVRQMQKSDSKPKTTRARVIDGGE